MVFTATSTGTFPSWRFDLADLSSKGEANILHWAERGDDGVRFYTARVTARGYFDEFTCYEMSVNAMVCFWAQGISESAEQYDLVGPATLNRVGR